MVKIYKIPDVYLEIPKGMKVANSSLIEVVELSELNFLVKSLIKNLQNELVRLSSNQSNSPDEAIEQRIKIEQTHVEITHLEELKNNLGIE